MTTLDLKAARARIATVRQHMSQDPPDSLTSMAENLVNEVEMLDRERDNLEDSLRVSQATLANVRDARDEWRSRAESYAHDAAKWRRECSVASDSVAALRNEYAGLAAKFEEHVAGCKHTRIASLEAEVARLRGALVAVVDQISLEPGATSALVNEVLGSLLATAGTV